jgi:hypothetical protein
LTFFSIPDALNVSLLGDDAAIALVLPDVVLGAAVTDAFAGISRSASLIDISDVRLLLVDDDTFAVSLRRSVQRHSRAIRACDLAPRFVVINIGAQHVQQRHARRRLHLTLRARLPRCQTTGVFIVSDTNRCASAMCQQPVGSAKHVDDSDR